MKLNELTGIKKVIDIADWLKDNNWKNTGNGLWGKVFTNENKPYVLKLYKVQDRAYTEFLNKIEKYNSIHLPKIGKARTIYIPEPINIVQIEKLEKLNDDTVAYACDFVSVLIEYYDINDYNELIEKLNSLDSDEIEIIHDEYELSYFPEINQVIKLSKNKNLIEIIISLYWSKPNNTSFDLHFGNFMKRQDGTIVIIDPYFGGSENITPIITRTKKIF